MAEEVVVSGKERAAQEAAASDNDGVIGEAAASDNERPMEEVVLSKTAKFCAFADEVSSVTLFAAGGDRCDGVLFSRWRRACL